MSRSRWSAPLVRSLGRAACALSLAALPAHAAGVTLGFQAETLAVAPGATFTAEIVVPASGGAFNAFDAAVRFDPARLAFVPTTPVAAQRGELMTAACSNTYHLFAARPDSLAITLVLLCAGKSVTGPGVIYRVQFAAPATPGWTRLEFGPSTQFYLAGSYVTPLEAHDLVVKIGDPPSVGVEERERPAGSGLRLAPPVPNPARGGAVTLRVDLAEPDRVALELLDALGRRVASRPAEPLGAGPHALRWNPGPLAPGRYLLRARAAGGGVAERGWVLLR